jgi:hypothetical protein
MSFRRSEPAEIRDPGPPQAPARTGRPDGIIGRTDHLDRPLTDGAALFKTPGGEDDERRNQAEQEGL